MKRVAPLLLILTCLMSPGALAEPGRPNGARHLVYDL